MYGSEAYAAHCDSINMNILGYFNLDMIGYSDPDSVMHTDIICPVSAMPLSDFFIAVKNIFVPSLPAHNASLSGGDSDHTSFNNHGFMGIFPFENVNAYSPYIHSNQDLVGISVNDFRFVRKMMQSNLASVATLARPVGPVGIAVQAPAPLSLYPNPATEQVTVTAPVGEAVYCAVYDGTGRRVIFLQGKGEISISLLSLPGGFYTVHVFNDHYSATGKFILKKQ